MIHHLRLSALAAAAEVYEREVAGGSLRGEAFEAALTFLRESKRDVGTRKARLSRARVVVVPPEVVALVEAIVRARAGVHWQRALDHMKKRRNYALVAGLRHEIGWVLHELGYADPVIAKALCVDRTTVVTARRTFGAKMDRDEVLAARVARLLGGTRAAAEPEAVAS